jgi:hypothetical protein
MAGVGRGDGGRNSRSQWRGSDRRDMQQSIIVSEMAGAKGRGAGRVGPQLERSRCSMVRAVLSEGMGIVGQGEAAAKCNNQRRSIGDIGA